MGHGSYRMRSIMLNRRVAAGQAEVGRVRPWSGPSENEKRGSFPNLSFKCTLSVGLISPWVLLPTSHHTRTLVIVVLFLVRWQVSSLQPQPLFSTVSCVSSRVSGVDLLSGRNYPWEAFDLAAEERVPAAKSGNKSRHHGLCLDTYLNKRSGIISNNLNDRETDAQYLLCCRGVSAVLFSGLRRLLNGQGAPHCAIPPAALPGAHSSTTTSSSQTPN